VGSKTPPVGEASSYSSPREAASTRLGRIKHVYCFLRDNIVVPLKLSIFYIYTKLGYLSTVF